MNELKLSQRDVSEYLSEVFPQVNGKMVVETLEPMAAQVRYLVTDQDLRPGGTVSGPAMFTLADCAFYVVTLAMIGRQALTVTTNCNINFMRKPAQADMIGQARIMKLGRSQSVGEVTIFSDGLDAPVAHATLTYAIPPRK